MLGDADDADTDAEVVDDDSEDEDDDDDDDEEEEEAVKLDAHATAADRFSLSLLFNIAFNDVITAFISHLLLTSTSRQPLITSRIGSPHT